MVGGGGVTPDINSTNPNTTRYVTELLRKSIFFDFSLEYAARHPEATQKEIEVTDELLQEFFRFVDAKKFDYEPAGMSHLKRLEQTAKEEDFQEELGSVLEQLRRQFDQVKLKERERSMDDIRFLLKRELTGKLRGADAAYAVGFTRDETLKKAVEVIKDRERMQRILSGSEKIEKN